MSSLYELTGERLALQATLEGMDLDADTIADTLEGESGALQAKIENYGFVIRNMEVFGETIKAEEKRLAERRKAVEAKTEKIKAWLLQNMLACGISKIECPAFSIAVRENPAKVIIDHEGSIPCELFVYPEAPLPFPDKKAISDAIKSGIEVPGAHLEKGKRLEIK